MKSLFLPVALAKNLSVLDAIVKAIANVFVI